MIFFLQIVLLKPVSWQSCACMCVGVFMRVCNCAGPLWFKWHARQMPSVLADSWLVHSYAEMQMQSALSYELLTVGRLSV